MIQQNRSEIESTCDVLLSFAVPELRQERLSLLSFVHHDLVNEVTGISTGSRFTQDSLSERLANAGLLPMFGFPTRQRFLFHEAPRALPAEGAVDRDLDIAISQFAPGSETVKDGVVHPPLGLWRTAALAIGTGSGRSPGAAGTHWHLWLLPSSRHQTRCRDEHMPSLPEATRLSSNSTFAAQRFPDSFRWRARL